MMETKKFEGDLHVAMGADGEKIDPAGMSFRGLSGTSAIDDVALKMSREDTIKRLMRTIKGIGEANNDIMIKVQAAVEATSIDFVKSVMRSNAKDINNRIKDLIKEDLEKISREMKQHVDREMGQLRKEMTEKVERIRNDMWERLGES
jgi:hypothetical protein